MTVVGMATRQAGARTSTVQGGVTRTGFIKPAKVAQKSRCRCGCRRPLRRPPQAGQHGEPMCGVGPMRHVGRGGFFQGLPHAGTPASSSWLGQGGWTSSTTVAMKLERGVKDLLKRARWPGATAMPDPQRGPLMNTQDQTSRSSDAATVHLWRTRDEPRKNS